MPLTTVSAAANRRHLWLGASEPSWHMRKVRLSGCARVLMSVASLQSLGYLPVSTATLCAATDLDFDLFIQHPGRAFAELYRERKYPLRDEDLERLKQQGVDHLYVRVEE